MLFIFTTLVYATYYPNALFATVSGVASDDTLSVRVKPNWHSKRIAALPPKAFVGVDECIKIARSTWCKVDNLNRNLGEYHEYGEKLPGWVNAKFLKFSNRGYVAIKGRRSCNYAISCSGGRCRVVIDTTVKDGSIVTIKTKSYPRNWLKGIGELDIPSGGEGYACGRLNAKIDEYLLKHKSGILSAKNTAKNFLKALESHNITKIKNYIHPSQGITITDRLSFHEPNKRHFTKTDFIKFYRNKKPLFWGRDYATADPVKKSLQQMMDLKLPLERVSKIITLHNLKGFKAKKNLPLKGYEFYWKGKGKMANYHWRGADVILAKIDGKWYVVGFLWNRWVI